MLYWRIKAAITEDDASIPPVEGAEPTSVGDVAGGSLPDAGPERGAPAASRFFSTTKQKGITSFNRTTVVFQAISTSTALVLGWADDGLDACQQNRRSQASGEILLLWAIESYTRASQWLSRRCAFSVSSSITGATTK